MTPLQLQNRRDPTHTTGLRKRLQVEMQKRFKKLRGDIRKRLEDTPPRGHDDVAAFMAWVEQRVQTLFMSNTRGLATQRLRTNLNTENGTPEWMGSILDMAFTRGLGQAVNDLEQAGQLPEFFEAARLARSAAIKQRRDAMQARTLEELKGVTDEMRTLIRRELVDGIEAGLGPRDVARAINDRVALRSQYRATVIARTEIIRAHHKAKMGVIKEAQADGVQVMAEFSTAGDGRVCPECAALEGKVLAFEDAENLIPVHPQCRCTVLPYFEGITTNRRRGRPWKKT